MVSCLLIASSVRKFYSIFPLVVFFQQNSVRSESIWNLRNNSSVYKCNKTNCSGRIWQS